MNKSVALWWALAGALFVVAAGAAYRSGGEMQYETTGYLIGSQVSPGDSAIYRWRVCNGSQLVEGEGVEKPICPPPMSGVQTSETKIAWEGHPVAPYVLRDLTGPERLVKVKLKVRSNNPFGHSPVREVLEISASELP